MNRYLLDTTALVDFTKGVAVATARILSLIESGAEVAVCSITITELYSGLKPQERRALEQTAFIADLSYWDIDWETAVQAGIWRFDHARRGVQLSTPDTIIAAVAAQHGAIVVTDNAAHFPMKEVPTLSARAEEGRAAV